MTPAEIQEQKRRVIAAADAAHTQYPQYAGHWDGLEWALARVRKPIRTKMGLSFEKGDITIVKPDDIEPSPYHAHKGPFVVAYSLRTHIDTSIALRDIELLEA